MLTYRSIVPTTKNLADLRSGFVEVYKDVFAGYPYCETYTDDDVINEVWLPHVSRGIMTLALLNSDVIGFGCAMPIELAPIDVQNFVSEQQALKQLPDKKVWYFSELGVRGAFRRKGVGTILVQHRIQVISAMENDPVCGIMRTAAMGSNSAGIYRELGWHQLARREILSQTPHGSKSASRVFFFSEI